MDPTSTTTAQDFSFIHLVLHADPVVQVVIVILGIASLWTWALIID
jgi:hypothetical protein